jgi:diphthine-ammonia ligase
MYQTVGQDAIEYVAQALDVPLYRRVISGTAVDVSSEYGSRSASASGALKGDETEDLYELLSTVKVGMFLVWPQPYLTSWLGKPS